MRTRRYDLATRLAPHVAQRFPTTSGHRWPAGAAPRRAFGHAGLGRCDTEQLAHIVERWALLVAAGESADGALAGPSLVSEHLHAGADLPAAVRAWAAATGCPRVALLAADLRACTTVEATYETLRRHAAGLRRAGQRAALRRLRRRCWTILAGGAVASTAAALALAVA